MADETQPAGTRERILEAALPLFAARGFDGTSTRQVAQAAGVNVATLAYHFEGKEGLYREVITRLHADLAAAMPSPPLGTAPERLVQVLAEAAWAFARAHRVHIRLSLRHVLDSGRHPDSVMDAVEPLAARADALMALLHPDWSTAERRLMVFGTLHTVVRFAIEDEAQLGRMLGLPPDEVDAAVARHLAGMLRRSVAG
jgi:AcrR family transcriptional regulator